MPQTTFKLSVIATLLLLAGGISAQAADETFTVRIENVSAADALKLSNGKTEPISNLRARATIIVLRFLPTLAVRV